MAVIVELPARVRNKYRCATRDTIDQATIGRALMLERDTTPHSNIELLCRTLPLSNQVVFVFGVSKQTVRNRLKTRRRTATILPNQHFDQVNQFMLQNALHGLQAIRAKDPRNSNGSFQIGKGLKEQRRGKHYFVTNRLLLSLLILVCSANCFAAVAGHSLGPAKLHSVMPR